MNRSHIAVAALLTAVACVALDARQAVAPRVDAVIAGQVIDAGTRRPIAGAQVSLRRTSELGDRQAMAMPALARDGLVSPSQAPPAQHAITDADGRFVLTDVAGGAYRLRSLVTGYGEGAYGRARPAGPDRQLSVRPGERLTDIVIRMFQFGAIAGSVVDDAGEPVVGVNVRAYRRVFTSGRPRLASVPGQPDATDDRGRYRLYGLVAGDYVVAVVSTMTTLPVAAAEEEHAAVAQAQPSQADTVRRRAETGAPQSSSAGIRAGDLQIQPNTNLSMRMPTTPAPASDGRVAMYPTTFHPAVRVASEAGVVTLGSGETRSGVDVQLQLTPAAQVSGTLAGPDGLRANHGVRLVAAADDGTLQTDNELTVAHTATDGDGQFTMLAPVGHYVLKAYFVPRPAAQFRSAMPTSGVQHNHPPPVPAELEATLWADVPVTVGPEGIADLRVTLRPGARIRGRVEFDGTAPRLTAAQLQRMMLFAEPLSANLPEVSGVSIRSDGTFMTNGYPPGRFILNVTPPSPWRVASIAAGGVDVARSGLTLGPADLFGVLIAFTDRAVDLLGMVQPAPGSDPTSPVNDPRGRSGRRQEVDATVVALPADYEAAFASGLLTLRSAVGRTELDGSYRLRLPFSGDYVVVALPADVEPALDDTFLRTWAPRATRVSVVEGQPTSLPLTMSRSR